MLTTYIRTKLIFNHRFNDQKDYAMVKMYVYELEKLGCNKGPLLWRLKQQGEIDYDDKGNFKVMRDGPIDPRLLLLTKKRVKEKAPLTPLHRWMMTHLLHVELPVSKKEMPVYFKAFLDHRHKELDMFFTVDAFSGRVHTPIVNLKGDLRHRLRFYGEPVISLDVKQMQPTILGKVLQEGVGDNPFSTAIDNGDDVYVLLQKSAGLATRPEGKKLLFQLIFGKPRRELVTLFKGDVRWVEWINNYKSREEPRNPHKGDKHTNLAWLLQYSEVIVMTDIWIRLMKERIPFLTIHDDVLCNRVHRDAVYHAMEDVLQNHFHYFNITVTL